MQNVTLKVCMAGKPHRSDGSFERRPFEGWFDLLISNHFDYRRFARKTFCRKGVLQERLFEGKAFCRKGILQERLLQEWFFVRKASAGKAFCRKGFLQEKLFAESVFIQGRNFACRKTFCRKGFL